METAMKETRRLPIIPLQPAMNLPHRKPLGTLRLVQVPCTFS